MAVHFPSPEPRTRNASLERTGKHAGGCYLSIAALVWNGVVLSIAATMFFESVEVPWFVVLFISLFIIVGLVIAYAAVVRLLATSSAPGATKISAISVRSGTRNGFHFKPKRENRSSRALTDG